MRHVLENIRFVNGNGNPEQARVFFDEFAVFSAVPGIHHQKLQIERKLAVPLQFLNGKRVPGSTAFVPAAAGLILAGEVIKDLTGI